MAGHMGAETVTQQCLEVIRVDSEKNLLLVKGSVPGANNSFVKVSLSVKKTSFNQKISDEIKQQAEAPAEAEVEATNEEG
jgi:large subunit ribosomal protein L3